MKHIGGAGHKTHVGEMSAMSAGTQKNVGEVNGSGSTMCDHPRDHTHIKMSGGVPSQTAKSSGMSSPNFLTVGRTGEVA